MDVDRRTFIKNEKGKDEKTERKVLYVASSRAKHFLTYIACLSEEDKRDVCEKLTGKRNSKAGILIGQALDVEVME